MKKVAKQIVSPLLEKPIPVPAFATVDEHGKALTQENLKGHFTILYFYPKDMTSGCTVEAREFRDALDAFKKCHARILGVSKDSCASHVKFIEKESLNFSLLSDKESALCEAFDVWKEKSMYGKKYMGIERTTFIINPEGHIVARFSKVKVAGHVQEVLAVLKSLKKG
jgi:peroxiredoxin Q/BCP